MSSNNDPDKIQIFIAYSRKDINILDALLTHLMSLKRINLVDEIWYDGEIEAGEEWSKAISDNLEKADIILLLLSANFLYSEYCYGYEMKKALTLHEEGKTHLIPIIANSCMWEGTPIAKLQFLPKDGKPILNRDKPDQAYNSITKEIKKISEGILGQRKKKPKKEVIIPKKEIIKEMDAPKKGARIRSIIVVIVVSLLLIVNLTGKKSEKGIPFAGNYWYPHNLKGKTVDRNCFEDKDSLCDKYGALFTWEEAKNACSNELGNGWVLPSESDWRAAAIKAGGVYLLKDGIDLLRDSTVKSPEESYVRLTSSDDSIGLKLVLGGWFDPEQNNHKHDEKYGLYWTADSYNKEKAWVFFLDGESSNNDFRDKKQRLSCRCIRNK